MKARIVILTTIILLSGVLPAQELQKEISTAPDGETVYPGTGTIFLRVTGDHLQIIDGATGSSPGEMEGGNFFWSFHPEGKFLSTASRTGKMLLWNLETGRSQDMDGVGPVFSKFSSDGTTFYAGFLDGFFVVYNLKDGTVVNKIGTESEGVFSVLDGIFLFAGRRNGQVDIFDLADGAKIHSFEAHQRPIHEMRVIGDGSILVTIAVNGDTKLWDADPGRLLSSGSEELQKRAKDLEQRSQDLKNRAKPYLPPPPAAGAGTSAGAGGKP